MNEPLALRRIDTGDFVGNAWNSSPRWTPYGRAIAAHYPIQVPLFQSIPVTLSNVPADLSIAQVILTRPQQYDVLIWGLSASQSPTIQQAGQAYLNITHEETGVPWVVPNQIGYAPLPAFAGMNTVGGFGGPNMPVMRLPEMFFLPKNTRLRLSFLRSRLDVTPSVNILMNLHGVQLINHRFGFQTPDKITMVNGEEIPVGSRVPWLACIPYGARPNVAAGRAFFDYELIGLQQTVSYTPSSDCDVEICDIYASFLDSTFENFADVRLLRTKLDDTRERNDWTPQFIPVQSIFGSMINLDPCMPYPKPHILRADHKILMTAQNNDTGGISNPVNDGTVTFRGVQRCKY